MYCQRLTSHRYSFGLRYNYYYRPTTRDTILFLWIIKGVVREINMCAGRVEIPVLSPVPSAYMFEDRGVGRRVEVDVGHAYLVWT